MVQVPISIGELFDKISILEIKREKFTGEMKENVERELDELESCIETPWYKFKRLSSLRHKLKVVNGVLWDIEDAIRDLEKTEDFGAEFIEHARNVPYWNEIRSSTKREINILLNSDIIEEKQYGKHIF